MLRCGHTVEVLFDFTKEGIADWSIWPQTEERVSITHREAEPGLILYRSIRTEITGKSFKEAILTFYLSVGLAFQCITEAAEGT